MLIDYLPPENWDNTTLFQIQDKIENELISRMMQDWSCNTCQLQVIEIETVNKCNNDCSFCPANYREDKRTLKYMDEDLFYKIISDLQQMNYKGIISLFCNNEPLIDKRITKFAEYVDQALPDARLSLYTNGLCLTEEIYKKLIRHLDYLIIDNYNDDMVLNDSVKKVFEKKYTIDENNMCKTRIMLRKKNQVLLSRGGLVSNKTISTKFFSPCLLPFLQMVVRPDGKISRCCQDVYGDATLGDLSISSVKETWNSEEYIQLRNDMRNRKRSELPYCCECDLVGLKNYFPAAWLYDYGLKFIETIKRKYDEGYKIAVVSFKHAAELIYLLKFFGIYNVIVTNDIKGYEDHYLIFGNYQIVDQLHLKIEDAYSKYIVYDEAYLNSTADRYIKRKYTSEDLHKNNIILFGTGCYAKAIMESFDIKPILIVDNDPQKLGTMLGDCEIKAADSVRNHIGSCKVIIAINDSISVRGQLLNMGVPDSDIIIAEDLL